jgi:uncharacterized membrane protein
MRWIDRGLSALLILGGVGHTFGVLDFYKDPHALFWSLTASILIFLLAALNLLRSWRRDRVLAAVVAGASAVYFIDTLFFGRLIGDMADFRVILFGVISLGLTLFGVRDAIIAPSR